ncbi:MAG: hypothetical protein K2V38_18770, partial [Gemmataceae bacterium]|nr:hypothetical protein [Gemmataceae bacterium]
VLGDWDKVDPGTGWRPGWLHLVKVCNALTGVARSVKGIVLPGLAEGEDPDDWLLDRWEEAGGDKSAPAPVRRELWELVSAAPEWTPRPEGKAPPPFCGAADRLLEDARLLGRSVVGPADAVDKVRRAFGCVERVLSSGSADVAAAVKALASVAAAVRMSAEDLGLFRPPDEAARGKPLPPPEEFR